MSRLSTPASVPPGTVLAFAGATAPAGYLLCYGQNVSRTAYAALFAALGTAWGSGDGSTTFGLPDLRGRAPFGKDDMGGSAASRITSGTSGINGAALGATGGDQRMQAHSGHTSGGAYNVAFDANPITAGSGSQGAGSSQNMPPAAIVNYIIKT